MSSPTTKARGQFVEGLTISPEQLDRAQELMAAGLFNATGLPVINQPGMDEYVIQARGKDLGRIDYNNGVYVLITKTLPDSQEGAGEVWMGSAKARIESVRHLAPNHGGTFVPCSNGENISLHYVMDRMADPYAVTHGRSPIPQIQ